MIGNVGLGRDEGSGGVGWLVGLGKGEDAIFWRMGNMLWGFGKI